MNKIGFSNFRKFQNFEPLEFGGITCLVGRNNVGKSTLVKALLLINNYFKSENYKELSFGKNILEDANIVTYGRAKHHGSKTDNFINFEYQFSKYKIKILVTGDDDKTYAQVLQLDIHDLDEGIFFKFDMNYDKIHISIEEIETIEYRPDVLENLEQLIREITEQLNQPDLKKTSKEYIELVSNEEKLKEKLKIAQGQDLYTVTNYISIEDDFDSENSLDQIVDNFLSSSKIKYDQMFNNIQNGEEPHEQFANYRAMNSYGILRINNHIFKPFLQYLSQSSIIYLGANQIKQSALFAIRDKNNALGQAIHEFKSLNILEGEVAHRFLLKWMQVFEVGDGFEITMHAGEAYEMKILKNDVKINLADKGMGSIQAMALLMKIVCVIKKLNQSLPDIVYNESSKNTTIIIEEPELNLHPALQSKLAELFLDVYEKYGINFIIETHSEYLIRNTQFLVKEKEFEKAPNDNPFCIIYFDEIKGPYKMNYREDGKFIEEFGSGFFDETRKIVKKML
jgi:predicted ATPase